MDDLFGWVAPNPQPSRTPAKKSPDQNIAVSLPPVCAPIIHRNEIDLANRRAAMAAIVEARIQQHMTLLDIAWDSGVSWDAVRSWAQGRREPTMGNLVAVAQTLGFEIILRKKQQD